MIMMVQKIVFVALLGCSALNILTEARTNVKQYIVYMGEKGISTQEATILSNEQLLAKAMNQRMELNGVGFNEAVVHHYTKSFRGFSVLLTPEEAACLSEMDEVVSVFESKTWRTQTTRSWEFLNIDQIYSGSNTGSTKANIAAQSDVIIGIIDGGIWPESKSFSDEGLPPVPSRFKGKCETGDEFNASNCNRKIIGARTYSKGWKAVAGDFSQYDGPYYRSARDADGHGTHVASIAAGAPVDNASVFGIGHGIVRGGAPGARLAIYKVCWLELCTDADMLAAFDDATNDGVDIISISIGGSSPQPSYFHDGISIGAFHAFRKGILISAGAGNKGLPATAVNVAPWIFTVAASSIDRTFTSNVGLGNNKILKGESVNSLTQNGFDGLVAGSSAAAPGIPQQNASFCEENTLDPPTVKGKVVVCTMYTASDNRTTKSEVVRNAGGVGIVIVDHREKDVSKLFSVIPGTLIGPEQAAELAAYLASDKNPTAYISRTSTELNVSPAPRMAGFSSMGPNVITPNIIKPDVTAPGVAILAAWSPTAIRAGLSLDFNIISGTSMACPHVSAVAALVKSHHPTWSPAAIKSAIMTTAYVVDKNNKPIVKSPDNKATGPFDYGSGHIDPVAALDPGLVYDHNVTDVINLLCSYGSTPAQLRNLTLEGTTCMENPPPAYNFNYPSIGVEHLIGHVSVSRTLTNCASGASVYKAVVQPPPGVDVNVVPPSLNFEKEGEKLSFTLNLTVKKTASDFVFGSIFWSDGKHMVYSPIAVKPTSL